MVDVVGDSFAPIGVESGRVVFFCWLVLFDQCAILDGRIWGRLGSLGKLVDRVGEGEEWRHFWFWRLGVPSM